MAKNGVASKKFAAYLRPMKAYQFSSYGCEPELVSVAVPTPKPGEIRIKVAAAALNFADTLLIKGKYQERPEPPVTLGMELAGYVDALGEGVANFEIGQRVACYSGQGGLAEYGCFPASRVILISNNVPFDHAASMLIAYCTSHLALERRARLQPNETLLVFGAAGGVGLTAVEIGKKMGARVIAAARGVEKQAVAKNAGADIVFDSEAGDLRESVKGLGGADVVYDPVGGDAFRTGLRAINPEGRILTIGFASGDIPQIPANHLLVKNVDVLGLNLGAYLKFNPKALTDSFAQIFKWYEEGGLRPHISHHFDLDHAQEALDTLKGRKATGKIVVNITH